MADQKRTRIGIDYRLRSTTVLIECFHVTSRQPYWCPKQLWNGGHVHSFGAPNQLVELFTYAKAFFRSNKCA